MHARLSKYLGKHTLKTGSEIRLKRGSAARFYFADFRFTSLETGRQYNVTEAATGHPWASFALGAINPAGAIAPASVNKLGQVGTGSYWFNTAGFAALPAYTRRANPWYYDGLAGPGFKNMDLSLGKRFTITERFKVQVRMDAFNFLNGMNWASPQMTVTASDFGKTNTQYSGYYGRQFQYSLRLEF